MLGVELHLLGVAGRLGVLEHLRTPGASRSAPSTRCDFTSPMPSGICDMRRSISSDTGPSVVTAARRIGQARGHGHLGRPRRRAAPSWRRAGPRCPSSASSASFFSSSEAKSRSPDATFLSCLGAGSLDVLALGVLLGLGTVGHHGLEAELVDVLRAQQHVVALAEHRGHDRQLGQAVGAVARGVVDGLLASAGMASRYSASVTIFCSLAL